MDEPDSIKIREALRQAERILAIQQETRESALRRAGEILRLAMATVGAVVVVAGILTTSHQHVEVWIGGIVLGGLLLVGSAVIQLSRVLAGAGSYGVLASGPSMHRILDAARDTKVNDDLFLASLVESAADWIGDSGGSLARLQAAKGRALNLYITGATLLLGAAVYIAGGAIHG